nr:reverse transcriptase domain-containing protein [Tanacetum cinerariifolium]
MVTKGNPAEAVTTCERETIEDFMERFKVETEYIKEAPECMRIPGFMHGVNNLELIKRLNEHVSKTMEEMMITTAAFTRGKAAAAGKKKGKFLPPPPMVTPVENRRSNKFYDFYNDKGHSTDECMQLKKQIEELVRAGKLSYLIKEIKQGRDQEITFSSLATSSGTEGPLVIEVEIGGHMIHRMYVDGGSPLEVLYEHCFNQIRTKVKNQMVLVTTSLTGFSGETIWPLGQLRLLVIIGDVDHSTRAWMNFMIEIPKEAGIHHENFKVALHPNFPDHEVAIEGTLSAKRRTELRSLLKENLDIFAWQSSDMTGGPELNYTPMEKLVLSLVFAAKRFWRYFQAHPVVVITNQPIKQIMSRPDVAGRLQKWSVMLGEHNITYRPRTSVKRQVLEDFLAEMPDESQSNASVVDTQQDLWTPFMDGSSCVDGFSAEILKEKSIQEKEVTTVVEEDGPTWMTLIIEYLKEGTLAGDIKEARKLHIKARQYELLEGVLYRRSFLTSWLRPGDFLYRSNDASNAVDEEKLGPKWEGPYEVMEALGDGAYKLRSVDRTVLPRTWNVANLKKYYL